MMKFDDKEFLAKRIRYYRKKMNMTQAELAEKVDLSVQHISRIESGCYVPSLKSFFMIVTALDIDLGEFGFRINETKNSVKDKLISMISEANDNELIFYKNSIKALQSSFSEVSKKLF